MTSTAIPDDEYGWLDEVLHNVRDASWSMGLQNASREENHSPRNNRRGTEQAKQQIIFHIQQNYTPNSEVERIRHLAVHDTVKNAYIDGYDIYFKFPGGFSEQYSYLSDIDAKFRGQLSNREDE